MTKTMQIEIKILCCSCERTFVILLYPTLEILEFPPCECGSNKWYTKDMKKIWEINLNDN